MADNVTVVERLPFDPRDTMGEYDGNRVEHIWANLISLDQRELDEDYAGDPPKQMELESMTLEWGWLDDIPKAGKMTLTDDGTVNWLTTLVQPFYAVKKPGGVWEVHALGLYYPTSPSGEFSPGARRRSIEIYDMTLPLLDDKVSSTYYVESGVNVTDKVKSILDEAYIKSYDILDSAKTVRMLMSWPPGTSKYRIAQDLLNSIDYNRLTMQWDGTLRSRPNRDVALELPVMVFSDTPEEGQGRYLTSYIVNRDLFNVPNRWIGSTRSDADTPMLWAVAENTDPESPTSYQARGAGDVPGRWVTRYTEDIDVDSQSTLNGIVKGLLTRLTNAFHTIEFTHPIYGIDIRENIEFHNNEHGDHVAGRVTDMELIFNLPGAYCKTKVREAKKL